MLPIGQVTQHDTLVLPAWQPITECIILFAVCAHAWTSCIFTRERLVKNKSERSCMFVHTSFHVIASASVCCISTGPQFVNPPGSMRCVTSIEPLICCQHPHESTRVRGSISDSSDLKSGNPVRCVSVRISMPWPLLQDFSNL